MSEYDFHVFLSHNSEDKPAVRELKEQLVGYDRLPHALTVWFDEDELRPGMQFQELLEEGIKNSSSVAVLVGRDGLGPWERVEMRAALDLATREKRPVIPVLMPGAATQPELPLFLRGLTWVDLREGVTDEGLDKLVWGITGLRPSDREEKEDKPAAAIFLSGMRRDEVKLDRLYHMLRGAGYRPWMAKLDVKPGERPLEAIRSAIRNCDFFLACVSTHAMDKNGTIHREIAEALDHFDEPQAGSRTLIPVRLDEVEWPARLAEIQGIDLLDRDGWRSGWRRLRKAIEDRGFPGIDKPPTPAGNRWKKVYSIRQPILDVITPTYILDNTYHFLDWNRTFDELVARPTRIRRGEHALEFIRQLANCREVIERSRALFGTGSDPLVDIELLHYDSPKYGVVLFQKIGSQLCDEQGEPMGWCVNLNILVAEQMQRLWDDLKDALERDLNWTRYAASYDRLLAPFDDYWQLLKQVVSLVGDAHRVIDLGAGTGNVTSYLLTDPRRHVWAVESNEAMLGFLRAKLATTEGSGSLSSFDIPAAGHVNLDRLTIIKEDILRLDDLPPGHFDAAVLMNVLYTVDDPVLCLQQAHRLLRPGGVLVLSTPHRETDVTRLLDRMQEVLDHKGLLPDLEVNLEIARRAHQRMLELIHRDTKEDIRRYLQEARFVVKDWRDKEYVDAVVVVRAKKP